jgi:threonine aldolase
VIFRNRQGIEKNMAESPFGYIDLRSDVKSLPPPGMRDAMYVAQMGDSIAAEDPSVNKLESFASEMFGKEAALFCPSGTMSNLLAIIIQAKPGEEAIIEEKSHICLSEVGGLAYVGGVMAHPLYGPAGVFNEEDLIRAIRPKGLAFSRTSLVCMENTHNFYGGRVLSKDEMKAVYVVAKEYDLQVHTDGERLLNACIALGEKPEDMTIYSDTLTIGLSKGLCAPGGSLLIGPQNLIIKARKYQKMLGGSIRKPGAYAAAGLFALQNLVHRLTVDHENAKLLAKGLSKISDLGVDPQKVNTNIVNVDISKLAINSDEFVEKARQRGLLLAYHLFEPTIIRMVLYRDITKSDVERAVKVITEIVGGIQAH